MKLHSLAKSDIFAFVFCFYCSLRNYVELEQAGVLAKYK